MAYANVQYSGRDSQNRRTYRVNMAATVTAEDEDRWVYRCCECGSTRCDHVAWVKDARSDFEDADRRMVDATP